MAFLLEQRSARIAEEVSEHLTVAHLFEPDTTLPFQYAELLRRKTYLEGEEGLGFAVLEDAVNCFQKYYAARDKKGKRLFREVEEWIMDEKDDRVFSFDSICESLGINPGYLRRGLKEWEKKQGAAHKEKGGRQLKNREVSIDVMVPSCSCCSGKLEQELAAAAGISEAEVRFVVPLRAQLRYDPSVARIDKIVGALKERGYGVALERAEFRIPHRPVMQPAVWKEKVRSTGEKFNGIISASINFTTSRIVVDYLPGLISAREIREAVLGWGALDRDSTTKGVSHDEVAGIHGGGPEPERVQRDHFHALHSLGPGFSLTRYDPAVGSATTGIQGN